MNWFSNLKIATKLLVGFIVVAMVAGGIGVVGITKINDIVEADKAMYELNTKPMAPILEVSTAFQRIRVNYREIALEKNYEKKVKFSNRIKELKKIIDDKLPEIQQSLKSEETKKAFAEIQSNLDAFMPHVEKIVALAMEGKTDQTVEYMQSATVAGLSRSVDNSIDKLADIKVKLAQEKSDENIALAKAAVTMTVTFLVIGVVLAIGLGAQLSQQRNCAQLFD